VTAPCSLAAIVWQIFTLYSPAAGAIEQNHRLFGEVVTMRMRALANLYMFAKLFKIPTFYPQALYLKSCSIGLHPNSQHPSLLHIPPTVNTAGEHSYTTNDFIVSVSRQSDKMQPPLKPQYFIYRQNGSMVPLIAMDELPPNVQIRGVSRTIPPSDTAGMMCIGEVDARHGYYVVDVPATQNNTNSILVDRSLSGSMHAPPSESHINVDGSGIAAALYPGTPRAYGIQEQHPTNAQSGVVFSNPTNVHGREIPPVPDWHRGDMSVRTAPGVKEYCSYWLRRGECDYAQQGCQFKHEMPYDLPTLNRLGLNDIPVWYRRMYKLASLHAPKGVKKDEKLRAMEHKNWRNQRESGSGSGSPRPRNNSGSRATSRAPSHTRPVEKTLHQQQADKTYADLQKKKEKDLIDWEALPDEQKALKMPGGLLYSTGTVLPPGATMSSGESSSATLSNTTAATTPETSDTDFQMVSSSDEYAGPGSPSTARITPGGRTSRPKRGSGKKQTVESPFRASPNRRRLASSSPNEADDDTFKVVGKVYGNGVGGAVGKVDKVKDDVYDHDD
jgi:hypothetical protein